MIVKQLPKFFSDLKCSFIGYIGVQLIWLQSVHLLNIELSIELENLSVVELVIIFIESG